MAEYMEYIIAALILFASAADAVRDAWMTRYRTDPYKSKGWYMRHAAKWVAFYPPLAALLVLHVSPWYWLPLIILSWVVWRLAVRHIGRVTWESHLG